MDNRENDVERAQRELDFALAVSREPDKLGCVLRIPYGMQGVRAKHETEFSLTIKYLRAINEEGVRVTGQEVLIQQAPLLRGPWRRGDRLTLVGGLWWLLSVSSLVCHADVVSASSNQAHLVADLWGGTPMPDWRGRGHLWIESDDQGVTSLRIKWDEKWKTLTRKGTLSISRTEVVLPSTAVRVEDPPQDIKKLRPEPE